MERRTWVWSHPLCGHPHLAEPMEPGDRKDGRVLYVASPAGVHPPGNLDGPLGVLFPTLLDLRDEPPPYLAPLIRPTGRVHDLKYRYERETPSSSTPKRARLEIRTSTPPKVDKEFKNELMVVTSNVWRIPRMKKRKPLNEKGTQMGRASEKLEKRRNPPRQKEMRM